MAKLSASGAGALGPRRLLRTNEVAHELDVSPSTLDKWRQLGTGPRHLKLGSGPNASVRYRREDVDAFLESRVKGER